MSDQMSRRGFMGAAATGAVALAGVALAGCSNTSASSEKSSEKEKAVKPVILVTSFGTSYNDSRHITIGAIEDAIREKYWQDYDIRRAFTAQIIIDKLKKRDGITIDNMTEALDRCVEDGVKEIVVQPTHLMGGLEYTDVKDELDKYADKFDKISLGDPLLTSDDDYKKVAAAIKENMASFDDGKTALCLMGHGTEADSNADYAKMQEVFKNEGLTQFFVGTVETEPTCEDVIAAHNGHLLTAIACWRNALQNRIHCFFSAGQLRIANLYRCLVEITGTIALTGMGTDGARHKGQGVSI